MDVNALHIAFVNDCSLVLGLSNTVDEPITLITEHVDADIHAMLLLRPEHHGSITLRVETQPVELTDSTGEAFDNDTAGAGILALDLTVQYDDELKTAARRALSKRRDIEGWIVPVLSADAQPSVRSVGKEEDRALNRTYRGKDYVINMLTFFCAKNAEDPVSADIVLCCMVIEEETREQKKSLFAHYAHLIMRNALHAQGYDHEDAADAKEVEDIEAEILRDFGFADPYADR